MKLRTNPLVVLSLVLAMALVGRTAVEAASTVAVSPKSTSKRGTTNSVHQAPASVLSGKAKPAPFLRDFTFHGNHLGAPASDVIERSISDSSSKNQCHNAIKPIGDSSCLDNQVDWIPSSDNYVTEFRRSVSRLSALVFSACVS
jgi:hypothetical protein